MVMQLYSFRTKPGRPLKNKQLQDEGTPELQEKRRALLLSCRNQLLRADKDNLSLKIKEGCLLHHLFAKGELTKRQLKTALSLRKLYHKAFLSMGIQTHLKSINGRLGQLKGRSLEIFESALIEKKWRTIANFLSDLKRSQKISSSALSLVFQNNGEEMIHTGKLTEISIKLLQSALDEIEKIINK